MVPVRSLEVELEPEKEVGELGKEVLSCPPPLQKLLLS